MTAPERAGAAGDPRSPDDAAVMTAASRPDGSAALIERLAAVEAGIHESRHRQPAAVVEEIARLLVSGATVPETAAQAGVSRDIIHDRLRRAGADEYLNRDRPIWRLESRAAELIAAYEAGTPLSVLADRAGTCPRTLGKFLVAHGVRLRHDHGWYRRRRHAEG